MFVRTKLIFYGDSSSLSCINMITEAISRTYTMESDLRRDTLCLYLKPTRKSTTMKKTWTNRRKIYFFPFPFPFNSTIYWKYFPRNLREMLKIIQMQNWNFFLRIWILPKAKHFKFRRRKNYIDTEITIQNWKFVKRCADVWVNLMKWIRNIWWHCAYYGWIWLTNSKWLFDRKYKS